jgi:CRP-like cAMP-binding protein
MKTDVKSEKPSQYPLIEACGIPSSVLLRNQYSKGQIIGDCLKERPVVVFIESGSIDVFSVSLDGKEVLLSTLSQGEVFGISNLFEEEDLRTVLQCKTDCVAVSVLKSVLRTAILQRPQAMIEYAKLCNRKIQFLIKRIEQLTLNSGRIKVVEHLLSHTSDREVELQLESKESLALTLGISRAALFRELSALQKIGAVEGSGSKVHIINRTILENLLQ